MKKIIILIVGLLGIASLAFAQSPEKINFQTVVRDNAGIPMANQNIDLRLTIASGLVQPYKTRYEEVFTALTTDNFGLINVHIGTGTHNPTHGSFSGVEWGGGTMYLHIEVNTGNGYVNLGASEMVSVPHAMFSNIADSVSKVTLDQLKDVQLNNLIDGEFLQYNQAQGKWIPGAPSNGLWSVNGNKIYYNADNVGIGTTNPTAGLTLGSSTEFAFATHFNPASNRDLLSLFGTSYFETDNFVGLGYETENFLNGQNQQVSERLMYSKSQGGYRWYINKNANGGSDASMSLSKEGYLGIGTDAPEAALHITGNDHIIPATPYGGFMIGSTNNPILAMDRDEIQAYGSNGNFGSLTIQRGGGNLKLCVNSGNVGIGSVSPDARLHIRAGNDAQLASNTKNGFLMLGTIIGNNIVMDDNEIMARDGASTATLFFQANGGETSTGDITKAHVLLENARFQGMYNNNRGPLYLQNLGGDLLVCNEDNGQVAIGLGSLSSNAKVNIQDDRWQLRLDNPDLGGGEWFIGASANNWTTSGNKLVFGRSLNEASGILVLDGTNQGVAIGTSSVPANYKLAVDGRIICEELRVRVSSLWPDYVFSDTYKLRSLEEVEAHIEENSHLPGIPAAAEIEAEGIPVGEMQKMMMEKIEELTLYVIDQNKQLKAQQAQIEALEAELKDR
ncbi:MAG: hypothetical protein AB8F95_03795 [Bacteroidia bacterium]